jgi:hypothetical protein
MGSQMANALTFASGFRFMTFSTAEAPRRHVVQVGDSKAMTRTCPEAALKSFLNWANEAESSSVRADAGTGPK